MRLQTNTVGARTLVTVVTAGGWIATTSLRNGHVILSVEIAVATLLFFLPLGAWLAPKMNAGLGRRMQTAVEFLLYSGFITLVTAQSVALAASAPFWYGVPTGFTIGIIPQIQSSWNRLYSILISIAIYAGVLHTSANISHFIQKDIYLYYLVVIASAFSVEATGVMLGSLHRTFGLIMRGIEAFLDAVGKITNGDPK